jgi:hypothetical protein
MIDKVQLSARMLKETKSVREKVAIALASPCTPEEQLPLVLDALDAAVSAMDAMTARMLADVSPEMLAKIEAST